jgi:hypothetical protein
VAHGLLFIIRWEQGMVPEKGGVVMLPNAERRISGRIVCRGSIRFTRFDEEETVTANLIDISEEGLGILTTAELKPGSALRVQVENVESAGSGPFPYCLLKSLGIVEVKWCRAVGDRWHTVYAAGAQYLLL